MTRVGSCSLCGGDVMAHVGPWWSINPPPPAKCSGCGAVSASDVVPMIRLPQPVWNNPCQRPPEVPLDNPYGELCPQCKEPAVSRCRCACGSHPGHGLSCKNNHLWKPGEGK